MENLKPCPMCGDTYLDLSVDIVQCRGCGLTIAKDTAEEAIAAWNTRPIEDTLRKQRDELAYFIAADPTDSNCLKVIKAADAYLKEGN